ncbi:MAG: hypothetical protein V2A79_08205, partial [Planctomycetota bacterium]
MRSQWLVMVTLGIMVGVFCAPAIAGDEEGNPPQPRDRGPGFRPPEQDRDPVGDETRFTEQLRDAAMAELELDEDQQPAIAKLFADHLEAVKKMGAERPEKSESEDQRERLRELEREAQAAREAGDREEARRLYGEIRKLREQTLKADTAELSRLSREFIDTVTEALEEEQVPKFQRLVRDIRARLEQGGPMLQFRRALRRVMTELDLTEDQRETVNTIVKDALKKSGRAEDHPEAVQEVMKQLHSGLRSELGPEFSDRFMAAVDKAQRDMKSREGVRRPPPRGDTP